MFGKGSKAESLTSPPEDNSQDAKPKVGTQSEEQTKKHVPENLDQAFDDSAEPLTFHQI